MEASTEVRKHTASSVLGHPYRVRFLTIANERPISASAFVREVLKPPNELEYKKLLSKVSYHVRELDKAGCLVMVDQIPRRGSFERVYQGTKPAHFTDEEWAEMPQTERCRISTVTFQGLLAKIEAAMLAHTFDSRDDRWLAWNIANVDECGWKEMTATLAATFTELERIREESEARLTEGVELEIPVTFGMMGFESAPSQ